MEAMELHGICNEGAIMRARFTLTLGVFLVGGVAATMLATPARPARAM